MDRVQGILDRTIQGGAELLIGGKSDNRDGGLYFEPMILANCEQGVEIMRDEIFGPVAPVQAFHDLDEAIAKANDSVYGLTSSIFTTNLATAMRTCKEIKFGETYITEKTSRRCRASTPGGASRALAGPTSSMGFTNSPKSPLCICKPDDARRRFIQWAGALPS
jgi:lactaldehyde dehydrogenase/glycolaldehyde dehydrogenase